MAVKYLITLTIVLLLGVVCARDLNLASKLKVDPGIFISLKTLRRLEAETKKNGTEGSVILNTTPADNLDKVDDSVEINISTTNTPDYENNTTSKDLNELDETNETTSHDVVENQTDIPLDSNDTNTDAGIDKPVTSIPNVSETTKNPGKNQQSFQVHQNIQWNVPQFPYGTDQGYYQQNPYQQMSFGDVNNPQTLGYLNMNRVLFNQQLPYSPNPEASNPDQHHHQTFLGQYHYPVINRASNRQMNLISLNPISMPLPYQQMYQPVGRN
ncbi:PREDICTED: uncharacterized protein LOC106121142 [Papilio xuthus]|uniref:Uncharacterized protein LOC106121142 n=1 Tax=Papilio xuthus TaxID=66420 RepID=A0AAJ6ZGD1_PAPXU|nr:PREDICTED: uncharacterized protein LOC106121142 [Papilio xuthus]